jgi:FKBP-type peptidyl-prolyl cis-trans isomerase
LIVAAFIALCFLPGCKTNDWADWKTQNEIWLEANKTKDGVQVSSSGLQYKIIADPLKDTGEARPNNNSTIICDYTLTLINGFVIETANNATLNLKTTIPGFQEGCHKIHNSGDIELYIPASLGYDYNAYTSGDLSKAEGSGTEGTTSYIPPHSTLIFKLHIGGITGE